MRGRIPILVFLVALFLLVGGLTFAVDLYFDWLWFVELGKSVIFTTTLYAKSTVGAVTLAVTFVFLYLNLWHANRGPGLIQIGIPTPTGQITAYTLPPDKIRKGAGLLSLVVALFMAVREADSWELFWRWLHRVPFGSADPVFGRDISFYFFSLPVLAECVRFGMLLVFLAAAGALVLYHFKGVLASGGIRSFGRRGRVAVHVSILAALFFLLLAFDAYLDRFQILYANHGPMFGATYADLHARAPDALGPGRGRAGSARCSGSTTP